MIRILGRNPFFFFYVVFIYIMVFSMWWGYLLFSKNTETFIEKTELDKINFKASGSPLKYEETDSYRKLLSRYKAQKRMVLGEGMRTMFIGIAIGLVSALALARTTAHLLYGIAPSDPLTFVIVPIILAVVGLLACWIPARRATRVDPLVALRYE